MRIGYEYTRPISSLKSLAVGLILFFTLPEAFQETLSTDRRGSVATPTDHPDGMNVRLTTSMPMRSSVTISTQDCHLPTLGDEESAALTAIARVFQGAYGTEVYNPTTSRRKESN